MRSQPHALFVVREVAPMTGRSTPAIFARDLCRALASAGAKVTIAAGRRPDFAPESAGLARLLEARDRGGVSLVEHEGALEGGDCQLVVFETPDGSEPTPEIVARAAIERAREANTPITVLHTTVATADACGIAGDGLPALVHAAAHELEELGDRAPGAKLSPIERQNGRPFGRMRGRRPNATENPLIRSNSRVGQARSISLGSRRPSPADRPIADRLRALRRSCPMPAQASRGRRRDRARSVQ